MKKRRGITIWWRGVEAEQFAIPGPGGDEEVPAEYVEVSWRMESEDEAWTLSAQAWSDSADAFWSYRETEHDAHREDPYVRALLQIPGAVPEEVALQGPTPTDWTPFEDGSER